MYCIRILKLTDLSHFVVSLVQFMSKCESREGRAWSCYNFYTDNMRTSSAQGEVRVTVDVRMITERA